MKIPCPNCRAVFGVSPSLAGQPARCPRCQATVATAEPAPPPTRPRRFFRLKTIVLLVGAFLLLRMGFVMGWHAADHPVAESVPANVPKQERPRLPKKVVAKLQEAEMRARAALDEVARQEDEPQQLPRGIVK
jgi:hypothetical protein